MEVANLLSHDPPHPIRPQQAPGITQPELQRSHQYPTRHSVMTSNIPLDIQCSAFPQTAHTVGNDLHGSPPIYDASRVTPAPKHVTFQLLFDGGGNNRARLPMRVQIYPHDTTDSIVTTVKNFYGLYESAISGVSFEDDCGRTLIARYENFQNNMTIYIRVIPDYSQSWQSHGQIPLHAASPISALRMHTLEEPLQMLPPQPAQALNYGQPVSRPSSRVARKKSASPRPGKTSRSASVQKTRSRTGAMSREDSFQSHLDNLNSDNTKGYASSDGEGGSVTSSRKARSEGLASAEISVDNIVEGNRRKRAKFESSELPLYVPPQLPAANSISSISPQRRSNGQENASPYAKPNQRMLAYGQPLQSPQSSGYAENVYGIVPHSNTPLTAPPTVQTGRRLRDRPNAPTLSARSSNGMVPRAQGILPTPDPTIASCISDEDVALQLMRLGDTSNLSYGRTSASTLDETLSGRADAASSATSESDEDSDEIEKPSRAMPLGQRKLKNGQILQPGESRKQRKPLSDGIVSMDSGEPSGEPSGDEIDENYRYDDKKGGMIKSDVEDMVNEYGQVIRSRHLGLKQRNGSKTSTSNSLKSSSKASKQRMNGTPKKAKASMFSSTKIAPSPTPLPPQSRKTSSASTVNFQHEGEEDLSTKPRCQRCRKSKKGCDRQRPCQRCKDAGIGIDGCISEDEGNGRKGRFGRHMGVAVKQDAEDFAQSHETEEACAILDGMAGSQEKSKKRKR